ncbi:MAG: hypothetical protein NT031_07400 [Planctomycetota bacterium]|nr:hypothetical protein [Planctomycetota bacterium]
MRFSFAAACVVWAAMVSGAAGGTVGEALDRAGGNRPQLEKALACVPGPQREGMEFLIANMPDRDLTSLSAEFLIENVSVAYEAFAKSPWAGQVSKELFLNDVLPYVNLNERRDNWRKDFTTRFGPLVKDCRTISQAAASLNAKIFAELKVRYSTERPKPDQSPYESTAVGKASCTGLAILLVDACRAVGIPARVAGAPAWADGSGNHTWVEVWDGRWHFTGAGEPAGEKLDDAWFVARASQAKKDHPMHALYAASFRRTGIHFPLGWDPAATYVPAVNVTERYATPVATTAPAAAPKAWPAWAQLTEKEQAWADSTRGKVVAAWLTEYFKADPAQGEPAAPLGGNDRETDALLKDNTAAIRKLAWQAYASGWVRNELEGDFKADRVTWQTYTSPYTCRPVGKKPANGWPMFIVMHGGGSVPKEFHDMAWKKMQTYYNDQPVEGYLYLALRAPNETWNGFYDTYSVELAQKLIRQMVVQGEVDPNKVYLMGYSHGGYGTFYQGVRIPDRFAAIHASAAAPTERRLLARNQRNTVFSAMIGEQDTMYGRIVECRWFDKVAKELRGGRTDIYPIRVMFLPGGHGGLPDRDMMRPMYDALRTPVPRHVTWEQANSCSLNWLATTRPGDAFVDAVCQNNAVVITAERASELTVLLDERLIDFAKPVTVTANGLSTTHTLSPSIRVLCQTLKQRGDPEFMFTARVSVTLPPPATKPK